MEKAVTPLVEQQPVHLGVGKKLVHGANPVLAFVLAALVAMAVFALFWKLRKTFGLKV